MSELIPFDFEGQAVRVVANGELWFVANDICTALSIKNPRDALARLDDDEKGVGNADTLGGNQEVSVINESGLYSLIFTSRKEAAKRFKKWVTAEVLPSIRKTGSYQMPTKDPALPIAPAARADQIVAASKSFSSFTRAARTIGMERQQALIAANAATERATGVDLISELDADYLIESMNTPPETENDGIAAMCRLLDNRDYVETHEVAQALFGIPPAQQSRSDRLKAGRAMRDMGGWIYVEHRDEGRRCYGYKRIKRSTALN